MLVYEHGRTEKIVERLRWASGIVPYIAIPVAVAIVGLAGLLAGTAIFNEPKPGAAVGLVVGILVGAFAVAFVRSVIEWMAQMLIAQGARLDPSIRSAKESSRTDFSIGLRGEARPKRRGFTISI